MNFGKWIVVAFILFALFIGILVTICVRQDISLVSPDYYNDELIYEEQIKRIANTEVLADKPLIQKMDNGTLEIIFKQSVDQARLNLFCPSDPEMDKKFQLKPTDKQLIDISTLKKGMYRVKLYWSANAKEYFVEEIINI